MGISKYIFDRDLVFEFGTSTGMRACGYHIYGRSGRMGMGCWMHTVVVSGQRRYAQVNVARAASLV